MTETERLAAIEAIKQVKARYFRGVDTADGELVRGILAEDCELDYVGCFVDPASGRDFFPAMSIVVRGRASWSSNGLSAIGIVTAHEGHTCEIEVGDDGTARGIWAMTDRLFMPPGGAFARLTGFGHYHETYAKVDGAWQIKTLRISRLRVEAV
jgi:SnoaL-like domain